MLAPLAHEIVEVELAFLVSEVKGRDIRCGVLSRKLDGKLRHELVRADLDDRIGKCAALFDAHLDVVGMIFPLGHELHLDEGKSAARLNMRLDLGMAALPIDLDGFLLLARLHMDLLHFGDIEPCGQRRAVDAEPAPCAHGNGAEKFLILHILPLLIPSCLQARY